MDRQKGTTLILALVLLLLATLLGLFALNVGIFAQRTSGADVRARVIHQTLEAALAQGVEYIKNNRKTVIANALNHQCDATDTTLPFPCGTVPLCAAGYAPSSGTTLRLTRRWRAALTCSITSDGSASDVDGNGNATDLLDTRSLPIGSTMQMTTAGNGFTVNYGVGVAMCMVMSPTSASSRDTMHN